MEETAKVSIFTEEQMRDYAQDYGSSVLLLIQQGRFNAAKVHAIIGR